MMSRSYAAKYDLAGDLLAFILIGSTALFLTACDPAPKEEEFVCERAHPESVSCGYPIYFKDGTRIDE